MSCGGGGPNDFELPFGAITRRNGSAQSTFNEHQPTSAALPGTVLVTPSGCAFCSGQLLPSVVRRAGRSASTWISAITCPPGSTTTYASSSGTLVTASPGTAEAAQLFPPSDVRSSW